MAETKLEPIETWQAEAGERMGVDSGMPLFELGQSLNADQMSQWIEMLLRIQTAAITRNDFYQQAADAMVQLIGLNDGLVILKRQGLWQVAAQASSEQASAPGFSQTVLTRVEQERATFFESGIERSSTDSLTEVEAYVASPIFDAAGTVAGVLYGVRYTRQARQMAGVRKVEALVVQLLAGIVSAGLARQAGQEQADRFRMQLEQFASSKLVKAMAEDPAFLDSREREISVLFGDVRGFTGLAQRVGPEKTFSMIRNLMDQLTGCILDEEGFIVDYAGDGIAAMWNAPTDQPDHAELACWAAVNMQTVMDKLSEFWSFVAGESLSAGIGINTGVAQVGNSGSRWRLKYSPLGSAVNLASRLEGANKFFGTSILIARETQQRLFTSFPVRRVGPVLVKGAIEPVQVFQVMTEPEQSRCTEETLSAYAVALQHFEAGEYSDAVPVLEKLLTDHPDAIAARLLDQTNWQRDHSGETPMIRLTHK